MKPKKNNMMTKSIYISEERWQELERIGTEEERPISWLIGKAIDRFIEERRENAKVTSK